MHAQTASRPRSPLPDIEFHDVHPIDVTEQELLGTANRLAHFFPELAGCRLVVEPIHSGEPGASYHARIDLEFPPGRLEVELPPAAEASGHNFTSLLFEALERSRRAETMHHCTHPPPGLLS